MKEEKKNIEIVVVNNNYEKMAKRKQTIIDGNKEAAAWNKKIDKAQKNNTVAVVVTSVLFVLVCCALLWLKLNIVIDGLPTPVIKAILTALVLLVVFVVANSSIYGYKSKTDAQRKAERAIGEALNFVTFIKGKKIKSYSITTHADIPYETQRVYLTFKLEDEQGKEYEYSSLDKWDLVMLPIIFDVIIDAESSTIFLPYESSLDDEKMRDKIKGQINDEMISIEREEKEKVAKQLAMVITEKDAIERVLMKNTEITAELKKDLAKTQESLEKANENHEAKTRGLFVEIDEYKKNSQRLEDSLKSTKSLLEKANTHEEELQTTVNDLKQKFEDAKNVAEATINDIKTKCVGEIQSVKEACEKEKVALSDAVKKEEAYKHAAVERAEKAEDRNAELVGKIASYENETKRLTEECEKAKRELDSTKKGFETSIDVLKQRYDGQIEQMRIQSDAIKKRHGEEVQSLKAQFAVAAKEAKDALAKKHAEEVDALHEDIKKLAEQNDIESTVAELNDVKSALKKATASLTAREKELAFERDKIKTLEDKLEESESKVTEKVSDVVSEKESLEKRLEEQKALCEKIKAEKESAVAAAKMQERSLVKERDKILESKKKLENEVAGMKDYSALIAENESLKEQVVKMKNENIEDVKRECEEKISSIKKEKTNMEKKMRDALESAAKEKAERIKGEMVLRKYLSEKEQSEYEKKMAKQEAEIAKAKERAEKAKQDAMKAHEEQGKKEEVKKPSRHLIY